MPVRASVLVLLVLAFVAACGASPPRSIARPQSAQRPRLDDTCVYARAFVRVCHEELRLRVEDAALARLESVAAQLSAQAAITSELVVALVDARGARGGSSRARRVAELELTLAEVLAAARTLRAQTAARALVPAHRAAIAAMGSVDALESAVREVVDELARVAFDALGRWTAVSARLAEDVHAAGALTAWLQVLSASPEALAAADAPAEWAQDGRVIAARGAGEYAAQVCAPQHTSTTTE